MDRDEAKEFFSRYNAASNIEKPRSLAEVSARYRKDVEAYKATKAASDGAGGHDQLFALYTEIKVLGWILGKKEQTIQQDTKLPSDLPLIEMVRQNMPPGAHIEE